MSVRRRIYILVFLSNFPDFVASPEGTDDASDATLLKQESVDEISRENKPDIGSPEEPKLSKCGTSIEAIQSPLDESVKTQQLGAPVVQQRASIDEEPHLKQWRHQFRLFTSRRIHSCIVASENTRVISALIIALLVVLSHVDQRLFGRNIVKSKSVVASRPLYMLLLTDVTIVLARLYLEKRSEFDEPQKETVAPHGDRRNWEKAEKVLERGLVVYQTIRAIFIDCSVYAVVVICGLSLL